MNKALILVTVFLLVLTSLAQAEDRGQGRLFLGSTTVSPSDANSALRQQGLQELTLNNQLGVEITLPALKILQAGFRYTHRPTQSEENPADPATEYKADLTQEVFMGVVRAPLVNRDFFNFDFVLGVGAASTEYKIKTATVDGSLDKKGYTSPVAFAGATVGLGYKKFFFTIEAGYEYNKVSSLKATNMTTNVDNLDLSGSYLLVGLLFNDVPVFTK